VKAGGGKSSGRKWKAREDRGEERRAEE